MKLYIKFYKNCIKLSYNNISNSNNSYIVANDGGRGGHRGSGMPTHT